MDLLAFEHDRPFVLEALRRGEIDYLDYELDNRVRIKLESKVEMKKRGLDSPDDADALALTFAQTVAAPSTAQWRPSYASEATEWS